MEFAKLEDLEALFNLCRKKGVHSLKLGDVEIVLGDEPKKREYRRSKDTRDEITSEGGLSDEELLMWSAVAPSTPETTLE